VLDFAGYFHRRAQYHAQELAQKGGESNLEPYIFVFFFLLSNISLNFSFFFSFFLKFGKANGYDAQDHQKTAAGELQTTRCVRRFALRTKGSRT
jgi:hypothetical protein